MTSSAPPARPLNSEKTLQVAWVTLLTAFAISCTLLVLAGYAFWYYRGNAMSVEGGTLILRSPPEWVNVQRKGHSIFEQARHGQILEEGYRVSIARSAGYGQATTIRLFDQSTIDMWAGADLRVEKLQTSRWNHRKQLVQVRQVHGYIRYDLQKNQPYAEVRFQVVVGNTTIELAPGGSYSIEIKPPVRQMLVVEQRGYRPTVTDIAVRSGYALVYGKSQVAMLQAGERLQVDSLGAFASPIPALWELIRDGTFSEYSEEEYNNTTIPDQPTLPRAQTWQVFSGASEAGASGGFFRLSNGCPPPTTGSDCPAEERIKSAWFIRNNDQDTNFTTGVMQRFGPDQEGIDISEYRSLAFSVWVRILYQSVHLAGERGTECPIMIRFLAKEQKPTDPEKEQVICIYTSEDPSQQPERAPGIQYYRVNRYEWFYLNIDLREAEWLPDARYLRSIEIYANGHDYDSRATMVSLIGSHHERGELP
jgi:hypothetical protein